MVKIKVSISCRCPFITDSTTGNNFTCICREGFQGALCDYAYCVADPCKNDGICLSDVATPICDCKEGYGGRYCEININECDSIPCQNNGSCLDLLADYECNCVGTGFIGKVCEIDIDECLTENVSCGGQGTCINTKGSYK